VALGDEEFHFTQATATIRLWKPRIWCRLRRVLVSVDFSLTPN